MALDFGLEFRGGVAAANAQQRTDQRIPVAAQLVSPGTDYERNPVLDWALGPKLGDTLAGGLLGQVVLASDGQAQVEAKDAAAAASGEALIFPPGTYALNTYTFTAELVLYPGAVLQPASGQTLTFTERLTTLGTTLVFDTSSGGAFTFGAGSLELCCAENFGAVADSDGAGTGTDNSPAFTAAFQAVADSHGTCVVRPGRYRITAAVSVEGGAPRIVGLPGARIDAIGYQVSSTQYVLPIEFEPELVYGSEGGALLAGYAWTQTGIIAGTKTLTFASVTGLAIGDQLWIEVGQSAADLDQPDWAMIATITGISGTDVDIDRAIPINARDYSGPGPVLGTVRQKCHAWKVTEPLSRACVEGLGLDYVSLNFRRSQDSLVRDISWGATNVGAEIEDCDGIVLERLRCDRVHNHPTLSGTWIRGYGWRNIVLRDLTCWRTSTDAFEWVSHSQNVLFDHITLVCDGDDALISAPRLFRTEEDVGLRAIVRDLCVRFATETSTELWILSNSAEDILFEDVQIHGRESTADAEPYFRAALSQVRGRLRWGEEDYSGETVRHTLLIPIGPSVSQDHQIPVAGLLKSARVYVSDVTGITTLAHYDPGTGITNNQISTITNTLSPATAGAVKLAPWTWLRGDPNARSTDHYIRVITNGTASAGEYLIVDVEMLPSSEKYDEGSIELNDFTAPYLVGAGAPSVNARFVGDKYYDTTASRWYQSVTIGAGASDWVIM